MITQESLKQVLSYDQETGIFTWLCNRGRNNTQGKIAGVVDRNNYLYIRIYNKKHLAHRVAWLYMYGIWPNNQIDHINGVRNDNRINNLREVTNKENCQNRLKHKNGHLIGTTFRKDINRWVAQVNISGKQVYLGLYYTQQEAHKAYLTKLNEV